MNSQLFLTETLAQWSTDPLVNNPICTTADQQQGSWIVSDGSGGAIITWWEYNLTTSDYNIFAQRIDSDGIIRWTNNGVAICINSLHQHNPVITSDGNGGAIIAWQDNRSGNADIYAQRINGDGVVQWDADGVAVCDTISDQTFPQLISDGNGGAIVTWQDLRGGSNYKPYAQRIDANGNGHWTPDGVSLSTNTAETPHLISDGNGGAIITWHQYTGVFPAGNFDIIAQQINANGLLGWGINGLVLCNLTTEQLRPQIVSDGSNGAIIIWEDYRNGPSYSNLYAQKVNSSGVVEWTSNGVLVIPNTLSQIQQKLLSDGNGGAYVTWKYTSGGIANTIYAQRLNSGGIPQWAPDGVSIASAGDSRDPFISTDGGTGAIISWYDYRGSGNGDIFAQKINLSGAIMWTVNGVDVCRNQEGQVFPQSVADDIGGTIISWVDARNSSTNSTDIYAQRVNSDGTLGSATDVNENENSLPQTFTLEQNYPNPFNPTTKISWQSPVTSWQTLKVFDLLGREIVTLVDEERPAGSYEIIFDGKNLQSGIYFYQLTSDNFKKSIKMLLIK